MSILCWNSRGAAHPDFKKVLKDMVDDKKPMVIFILETRIPASRIEATRKLLKYDSARGVDSNGLSGGIWLIWDSTRVTIDLLPYGNQAIHAFIKELARAPSSRDCGTHT